MEPEPGAPACKATGPGTAAEPLEKPEEQEPTTMDKLKVLVAGQKFTNKEDIYNSGVRVGDFAVIVSDVDEDGLKAPIADNVELASIWSIAD